MVGDKDLDLSVWDLSLRRVATVKAFHMAFADALRGSEIHQLILEHMAELRDPVSPNPFILLYLCG